MATVWPLMKDEPLLTFTVATITTKQNLRNMFKRSNSLGQIILHRNTLISCRHNRWPCSCGTKPLTNSNSSANTSKKILLWRKNRFPEHIIKIPPNNSGSRDHTVRFLKTNYFCITRSQTSHEGQRLEISPHPISREADVKTGQRFT